MGARGGGFLQVALSGKTSPLRQPHASLCPPPPLHLGVCHAMRWPKYLIQAWWKGLATRCLGTKGDVFFAKPKIAAPVVNKRWHFI